jgi:hypothetical protein
MRQEGKLIPGNYHITFEILQFLRLLIDDTSKDFIGPEPPVDVGNTDQSVARDWNSSMMFKFPEDVVNGKVHQMLVERVLFLHRDTEFV